MNLCNQTYKSFWMMEIMKYPILGIIGAVFVTVAIALGAYGAHGHRRCISQTPKMERAWGNAVDYQMFHGLALFLLGVVRVDRERVKFWVFFWNSYVLGSNPFLF